MAGCDGKDTGEKQTPEDTTPKDTHVTTNDGDGDGITAADGDCDDADANVYPGREEECNGQDDNCNGVVDEGFEDTDNDGTADCVDSEECDGVDNDGNGQVDEGFADADGDGIADCVEGEECDGVDNNGDGRVDEGYDADSDGYTQCGTEKVDADCDDDNPNIYPGAEENPSDGIDNDCDELIDEGSWAEGDLTVVEIMNNPLAVSDAYGEWFEIYNSAERPVYLNGIVITSTVDKDYHVISSEEPLLLGEEETMVLGIEAADSLNGDVDVGYQYEDIILSNESDDLVLLADDVLLDQVVWDDGATMPDSSGSSMSFDITGYYGGYFKEPASVLNDEAEMWCYSVYMWGNLTDYGTPAELNEYCHDWDHDGDGYTTDDGDCDDGDETVYPGAPEQDPTLDNDCDGDVEMMPTAVVDYDPANSTLLSCDPLYLLGSNSFDPDGSALTYTWELTVAPGGSARTTADIQESTDADPTFYPDVAGDYEFTLTVNDGGTDSVVATLAVTISDRGSNSVPVADAGVDQSFSDTVTCSLVGYNYECDDCTETDVQLDGTGTADADDLDLTYSWSITSGSSYGTLDDSTLESPILSMSGLTCTYGSTATYTVSLTLTVTDCPGDSSSDSVSITYTCTGE